MRTRTSTTNLNAERLRCSNDFVDDAWISAQLGRPNVAVAVLHDMCVVRNKTVICFIRSLQANATIHGQIEFFVLEKDSILCSL